MNLQLARKTPVVTGTSRGIGLAAAQALTREGTHVVGGAHTITPELEAAGVAAVPADLSTQGAGSVIDAAIAETGGVDVLVNNVGGGDADQPTFGGFLDADDAQWRDLFDLNLFSAVSASRAALPNLIERCGTIVNVASINARVPATGPVGYSEANTVGRGVDTLFQDAEGRVVSAYMFMGVD